MRKKSISCTLIISTYNSPAYLRQSLQSVLAQSVMPAQVIVADDGSGEDTRRVVEDFALLFASKTGADFCHVWQPDEGFRLASIRNKALTKATGDYIVMTDGDIILHSKFIADHLHFAKYNTFVAGTRVMLTQDYSNRIAQSERLKPSMCAKGVVKSYKALRWRPMATLNERIMQHKALPQYVLGCNMSFWKKDIFNINGYNEDITGWGKEDNDAAVRLINAGIKMRMLYFAAIAFHLYHKENSRKAVSKNEDILRKSIEEKLTRIDNGIYKNVQA